MTEPMRVTLDGGPVLLYAAGVVIGIGLIIAAVVSKKS